MKRIIIASPGRDTTRSTLTTFLDLIKTSPSTAVHVSASWPRARSVRAAVDLSTTSLTVSPNIHSIQSLCTLRLNQLYNYQQSQENRRNQKRIENSWKVLESIAMNHIDDIFLPSIDHRFRKPADPYHCISHLLNLHSRVSSFSSSSSSSRNSNSSSSSNNNNNNNNSRALECIEDDGVIASLNRLNQLFERENIVPMYKVPEEMLLVQEAVLSTTAEPTPLVSPPLFDAYVCDDIQDWTRSEINALMSMVNDGNVSDTQVHGYVTPTASVFEHRNVAPSWYFQKKLNQMIRGSDTKLIVEKLKSTTHQSLLNKKSTATLLPYLKRICPPSSSSFPMIEHCHHATFNDEMITLLHIIKKLKKKKIAVIARKSSYASKAAEFIGKLCIKNGCSTGDILTFTSISL